MIHEHPDVDPVRPPLRRYVAAALVAAATAQAFGLAMKMPTPLQANDISRWCTVWSLLERGTYAIDDCPWQGKTQDKVFKLEPARNVKPGAERVMRYYSSKPPLLPTLIAGILYPFRVASGVPLDASVSEVREPRNVSKEDPDKPGIFTVKLETPAPVLWPVNVFYFKPVLLLLNVIPFALFLLAYARLLDRRAADDWSWTVALMAAAFATPLLPFCSTLNNHTVAAFAAFFALDALLRIEADGGKARDFALAGFFGAFCACNELPAAAFGVLLAARLLIRDPRRTLVAFVPPAAVVCVAFLVTQQLATGQWKPVYSEFGTQSYNYEGSYWNTPLEMDWFDKHPEPWHVYLFHMTLGHHGIFSLTPIFAFSIWGAFRDLRRRGSAGVATLTLVLTPAMLAFYTWKTHNYGGSTNGLRWLFWLIPFWLLGLPSGLEACASRPWARRLGFAALAISLFSIGYALRNPWSHPWIQDLIEHFGLYSLKR